MKKNKTIHFLLFILLLASSMFVAAIISYADNSILTSPQSVSKGMRVGSIASNENMISVPIKITASISIKKDSLGDLIEMPGFASGGAPGEPVLPLHQWTFLLPENVIWETVSAEMQNASWEDYSGSADLVPASPAVTYDEKNKTIISWGGKDPKNIVNGRDITIYNNDSYFPRSPLGKIEPSKYQRWILGRITIAPVSYNPVEKKIRILRSATVLIKFDIKKTKTINKDVEKFISAPGRYVKKNWDKISGELVNPENVGNYYPALITRADSATSPTIDYVIVTTEIVKTSSTKLADFIAHKESLGYTVAVITEGDTEDDSHFIGGDSTMGRAINIRNWLKARYASWGIEYVLLIGNPDYRSYNFVPSTSVPMMSCWADASDEINSLESPSDMFYAELSGDWDISGNGIYGELNKDMRSGGADRDSELSVGRIPHYRDIPLLDSILQKMINYDSAETNLEWRKKLLIPTAILNFGMMDENLDGVPDYLPPLPSLYDDWGELMKNLALSNGYSAYTLYEKYGCYDDGSAYPLTPCNAPLTYENLLNEWRNHYGYVTWTGHGSMDSVARYVWDNDNFDPPGAFTPNDHVAQVGPEAVMGGYWNSGACSALDDDYPSFVVQVSCLNGSPITSGNLGYSLLKHGAIGTLSGSTLTYYRRGAFKESNPEVLGDNGSYPYIMFSQMVANKRKAGESLAYCRSHFGVGPLADNTFAVEGWHNALVMNLYGDPEMQLEPRTSPPPPTPSPSPTATPSPIPTPTAFPLSLKSIAISGGDGNDTLAAGECADLNIELQCDSLDAAAKIHAVLTSSDPGIKIISGQSEYPDINPGESQTNITAFQVCADSSVICPTVLKCTLSGTVGDSFFSIPVMIAPEGTNSQNLAFTNDTPVDIPDFNASGASSEIYVENAEGIIGDVSVALRISHPYIWDLDVSLISPDGTIIKLIPRWTEKNKGSNIGVDCPAGSNDTIFSDLGTTSILCGTPPFIGVFSPAEPFSAFYGMSGNAVNGTWEIFATDSNFGDTGQIECWTLNLMMERCTEESYIELDKTIYQCDDEIAVTVFDPNSKGGSLIVNIETRGFDFEALYVTDPDDDHYYQGLMNTGLRNAIQFRGNSIIEADTARPISGIIAKFSDSNKLVKRTKALINCSLCDELIYDGSFETTPTLWQEYSSNGEAVIWSGEVSIASMSGNYWLWFGGWNEYIESSVQQSFTIPSASTTLEFNLAIPDANGPQTDFLRVKMDDTVLAEYHPSDAPNYTDYKRIEFDISAFADGGTHTLLFESITDGTTDITNFFVDDVAVRQNCIEPAARQNTVYVAPPPEGNNDNDGSESAPFATLMHGYDAVAEGGTVFVKPGEYSVSTLSGSQSDWFFILYRNNITIRSIDGSARDGSDDTILRTPSDASAFDFVNIAGSGNTLQGFKLINDYIGSTPWSQSMIAILGNNNRILNNQIIGRADCSGMPDGDIGIYIHGYYGRYNHMATGNLIEGNEVSNTCNGISIISTEIDACSTNTLVQNNFVHDTLYSGIVASNAPGTKIIGNHVSNCSLAGIAARIIPGIPYTMEGSIIKDNLSEGQIEGYGIGFESASGVICTGNTVKNNGYGIGFRKNSAGDIGVSTVQGNFIYGNVNGIGNAAEQTVDARFCFWGDASGPGGGPNVHDPVTGAMAMGNGDAIYGHNDVRFDPWLTSSTLTLLSMQIDQSAYSCDSDIQITVTDPSGGATVKVTLFSAGGDMEIITLSSIDGNHIYQGSIHVAPVGSMIIRMDNLLEASPVDDDFISLMYQDTSGNKCNASAGLSCSTCLELIFNGDFEEVESGWTVMSNPEGSPGIIRSAPANSGTWSAYFGGFLEHAETSIEQNVVIPPSTAFLEYFLSILSFSGPETDFLRVKIDDIILAEYHPSDASQFESYKSVQLDISGMADGGSHLLKFESVVDGVATPQNLWTYFCVDDVSIKGTCTLPVYTQTTVYVAPAPEGDDANDGSEAHPFATIQRGYDVVAEGGSVIVKPGLYNNATNPANFPADMLVLNRNNITVRSVDNSAVDGSDDTILQAPLNIDTDGFIKITGDENKLVGFKIIESITSVTGKNRTLVRVIGNRNSVLLNRIIGFPDDTAAMIANTNIRVQGVAGTKNPVAESNHIEGNESSNSCYGINVLSRDNIGGSSNTVVRKNEVFNNKWYGIFAGNSPQTVILENHSFNNDGVGIAVISANGYSTVSDENVVSKNIVEGHTSLFGLYFASAIGTKATENIIRNNKMGIYIRQSPLCSWCVIYEGVPELNFNSITGYEIGLQNSSFMQVDARDNWWGDPTGPSGGTIDPFTGAAANGTGSLIYKSDDVRFDPFFTFDNSEPYLRIEDSEMEEGDEGLNLMDFWVTFINGDSSTNTVTLEYSTESDTAVAGEDFETTNGALIFQPGDDVNKFSVNIIGEHIEETDEGFLVNLSTSSPVPIYPTQVRGTIINDDNFSAKINSQTIFGGNGDDILEGDECVNIFIELQNDSNSPGKNIHTILSTVTPGVTVIQGISDYEDMPAGSAKTNLTAFEICTTDTLACPDNVKLTLNVSNDIKQFSLPIIIPIGKETRIVTPYVFEANMPFYIPDADANGVESPLDVSNIETEITDISVAVHITHTFDGDLKLALISPDGTKVSLAENVGESGDNFGIDCPAGDNDTIFCDSGEQSIVNGVSPFIGKFIPVEPLSVFIGKSQSAINGTWKLRAEDLAGGDDGTIDCWSLTLISTECKAANILSIVSEFGSTTPKQGIYEYAPGTNVTVSLDNAIVTDGEKRHVCTGYTIVWDGGADSGPETSVPLIMDKDTTITFNWKTQYYLDASANPPESGSVLLNGTTTEASGWYDENSILSVFANPNFNYKFDNWSGAISGNVNPADIYLASPITLLAEFHAIFDEVNHYNFDPASDGWTSGTIPGIFTAPIFTYDGSSILISPTSDYCFGFWQSPTNAIPASLPHSLYAVTFSMKSDIAKCLNPILRLRTNAANFSQANLIVINSISTCDYEPSADYRAWTQYFEPQNEAVGQDFLVAIDMLNIDPADATSGTISIDYVNVDRMNIEDLENNITEKQWTFDESAEGWMSSGQVGSMTAPEFADTTGSLSMTSLNNTDTFGFWNNDTTEMSFKTGKLYKASFDITSSTELTENSAIMRGRTFTGDNQSILIVEAPMMKLSSAEKQGEGFSKHIFSYFAPPQSIIGTINDKIGLAIDLININPSAPERVTLSLEQLNLETFDIPYPDEAIIPTPTPTPSPTPAPPLSIIWTKSYNQGTGKDVNSSTYNPITNEILLSNYGVDLSLEKYSGTDGAYAGSQLLTPETGQPALVPLSGFSIGIGIDGSVYLSDDTPSNPLWKTTSVSTITNVASTGNLFLLSRNLSVVGSGINTYIAGTGAINNGPINIWKSDNPECTSFTPWRIISGSGLTPVGAAKAGAALSPVIGDAPPQWAVGCDVVGSIKRLRLFKYNPSISDYEWKGDAGDFDYYCHDADFDLTQSDIYKPIVAVLRADGNPNLTTGMPASVDIFNLDTDTGALTYYASISLSPPLANIAQRGSLDIDPANSKIYVTWRNPGNTATAEMACISYSREPK